MASQELVPFTYAREAFNTLHGTELPEHNGLLSHEQARSINDQFDIKLHLGVHGSTGGYTPDNPHGHMDLPTQREYAEAASVVDSLQPGDTLFVEGYGFREQPIEPVRMPQREGPLSLSALVLDSISKSIMVEAKRALEQARHDYSISAWAYARQLAILKGVRVVIADYDAFDKSGVEELGGKELRGLGHSTDERDKALAKGTHTRRELAARNIVKDWALDHLQPENTPTNERGRKPKLALLFGDAREEGLVEAFNDMGLEIKVNVLESTDMRGRAREQVGRVMRDMLPAILASLATPIPVSPAKRPDEK